jgi:hypothetical protein
MAVALVIQKVANPASAPWPSADYRAAAGGVPGEGAVRRVAAACRDVLLDPGQRGRLVEQPAVVGMAPSTCP